MNTKEILNTIKELKFNNVIFVGEEFKKVNDNFISFTNVEELITHISKNNISGKKILIKGSHSIHLEKLVNIL